MFPRGPFQPLPFCDSVILWFRARKASLFFITHSFHQNTSEQPHLCLASFLLSWVLSWGLTRDVHTTYINRVENIVNLRNNIEYIWWSGFCHAHTHFKPVNPLAAMGLLAELNPWECLRTFIIKMHGNKGTFTVFGIFPVSSHSIYNWHYNISPNNVLMNT